jgi:TRAP-type C4-dicarboxylate transport system substrate-binding protein
MGKLLARFALGLLLAPAVATTARAETTVIKIATLAPEGSSWMKVFHEFGQAVEKRAPTLKVKYYAGGVAGDERDAVRKMRLGQINGAAVTAIGLGLIQPEVRVLELPFIFNSFAELDYVRTTLDGEFRKKFEEKGYVLLAWGDVGPVHLFTNTPVKSRDDLNQLKLWAWTDDPVVRTLFQQLGLNGVPLGVPDVLPGLQTGLINACYGSPLATLALQWNTKVKYMTSMVIGQSIGAIVLTKAAWSGLAPDAQKVLAEEAKKMQDKLLGIVRTDNGTALKKMLTIGMQEVPTPAPVASEFEKQGRVVAQKLEGQLYSHEFRGRVEKLVAEYRATHK